jgi:hypothetical protein
MRHSFDFRSSTSQQFHAPNSCVSSAQTSLECSHPRSSSPAPPTITDLKLHVTGNRKGLVCLHFVCRYRQRHITRRSVQTHSNRLSSRSRLDSVAVPGQQDSLGLVAPNDALSAWQVFAVEFVLSFMLVFAVCSTLDPNRRCLGSDSLAIGIAYLACSITGVSLLSPSVHLRSSTINFINFSCVLYCLLHSFRPAALVSILLELLVRRSS